MLAALRPNEAFAATDGPLLHRHRFGDLGTFGPGAEIVMDGNSHTINNTLAPEGYDYVPKDDY